jgi:hypothetical protein
MDTKYTKEDVIELFNRMAEEGTEEWSAQDTHKAADGALLHYIYDDEITIAFRKLRDSVKWDN